MAGLLYHKLVLIVLIYVIKDKACITYAEV